MWTDGEDAVSSRKEFLNGLPPEVRVMVYKMLPNADVLNMRLVNRLVKKEIDEYMDFHIILDQSYRKFRQLCNFRIRSIKVNLLSRRINHGLHLSYPERVKKVIFDGLVSPANLMKILTLCKHVQELVFTHETLGFSDTPPVIRLWMKHAETLKCLELQAGDQADAIQTEIYLQAFPSKCIEHEVDLEQLKRMKLTDFRFRDDVLFLNTPVKNIIVDLISRQTKLQVFHFHSPGDLTWKQLKELVTINVETITDITINNLKAYRRSFLHRHADLILHPSRRADMECFSNCKKLKHLTLSCSPPPSMNPNQEEGIPLNLVNLQSLPSALETLYLRGFTFRMDEILTLTKYLPNLREFVLVDGGRIQYSVLINGFLRNCHSLEFLNVRPVIARGSSDSSWWKEIRALNLVFNYFMKVPFDIDDLDGLEARIRPEDRDWISTNILEDTPTTY
ncbi:unnamed protein product [Allacma fusca]|uniref:F-box domain-containing protein n=1 Tax=Allacma fusca TaxID=39272 RepID=A0A8J2M2H8_9HEXA|nr:unnamed protein product [Allacma fusca]